MCPATDEKLLFVQSTNVDPTNDTEIDKIVAQPLNNPVVQPTPPTVLNCSRCKRELPVTRFYKTINRWCEGRGYSYICKDCSRASAKESADRKRQEEKDAKTNQIEGQDTTS